MRKKSHPDKAAPYCGTEDPAACTTVIFRRMPSFQSFGRPARLWWFLAEHAWPCTVIPTSTDPQEGNAWAHTFSVHLTGFILGNL